MIQVCFVCLGNICRSPLAHGVFEALVDAEGLQDKIIVTSGGVGAWHVGESPDPRMQKTAKQNGIHLNTLAQQFKSADFNQVDLVLAMDQSNFSELKQICPRPEAAKKLVLFRSFDPESNGDMDVPDPYYGGSGGFEKVFEIVHRTCPKILEHLKSQFSLL